MVPLARIATLSSMDWALAPVRLAVHVMAIAKIKKQIGFILILSPFLYALLIEFSL